MYREFKEKVKVIEVRPAPVGDAGHALSQDESNMNATTAKKEKFYAVKVKTNVKKDPFGIREGIESSLITAEENASRLQKIAEAFRRKENKKSTLVEEIRQVNIDEPSNTTEAEFKPKQDNINSEKKNKGKKRKKKKKKKEKATTTNQDQDASTSIPAVIASTSIPAVVEPNTEEIDKADAAECDGANTTESSDRKWPCVFGFIATWIAKREEKRRAKKRKAIASRTSTPVKPLVEYEHKKAKGGMAFTVEVDNRPMKKAVLPPIKQKPGGVMNGIEEKLEKAEKQRSKELEKKKKSSKEHGKKKTECQERKAESEFYYKQKVDLTTKEKQFKAAKNRQRIQEDPSFLRVPSTLPPIGIVRVKPAAGSDTNPDEVLFDF